MAQAPSLARVSTKPDRRSRWRGSFAPADTGGRRVTPQQIRRPLVRNAPTCPVLAKDARRSRDALQEWSITRSGMPLVVVEDRKKRSKPLDAKGLCSVARFPAKHHCKVQYPLGESNPCRRTENPMSWATRRRGPYRLKAPAIAIVRLVQFPAGRNAMSIASETGGTTPNTREHTSLAGSPAVVKRWGDKSARRRRRRSQRSQTAD
jgi:hypothetical protein